MHLAKYLLRAIYLGNLALASTAAFSQTPQALIQQVVDTERSANQNDHSQWTYLQHLHTAKEQTVQWVAETQYGSVQRILTKNGQTYSEQQQRSAVQNLLGDTHTQKKEVAERAHDNQQVDDLLKLLPSAFVWTETGNNPSNTYLHFEPAPNFHPPTREARVFAGMAGDLVVDNTQHRIVRMNGHLIHEVTFGGGLLGKLKQGSSFALAQAQVAPEQWQLSEIHVQLDGNALLFKSISLQQEDDRSHFLPEPQNITLQQASDNVMHAQEKSE